MHLDRREPRKFKHCKRFSPLSLVIITGVTACDNVAFGGVQIELRPPEEPQVAAESDVVAAEVEAGPEPLAPVELDRIVYVVQRRIDARATILPIAQLSEDGYEPLPYIEDIPDLIERFSLGRWDTGAEFALLAQGSRVGTFVADGTTQTDDSTCQSKPRGSGHLEVRPEAAESDWFLALPVEGQLPREPWTSIPRIGQDPDLQSGSLNLAQRMIPVLDVLWPPSIPEVRRDLQRFSLGKADGSALAVSYVYGDRLRVGRSGPRAYALFMLAAVDDGGDRYEPLLTWHQEAAAGKAFPRFIGAHDTRGVGSPDAVIEVFGETSRWFAILGVDDEEWSVLYLDSCGEPASRGAIRTFP